MEKKTGILTTLGFAALGGIAAYMLTRRPPAVPAGTGEVTFSSNRSGSRFRIDGGEWTTTPAVVTFDAGTTHNIEWEPISGYDLSGSSSFTVIKGSQTVSVTYTVQGETATVIVHISSIGAGYPGSSVYLDADAASPVTRVLENAVDGDYSFEVPAGHQYLVGFGGSSGWMRTTLPTNQRSPQLAGGDTWEIWSTYVYWGTTPLSYMWDFNQDGIVDAADDAIFAAAYEGAYDRRCDFYNDGVVGTDDLEVYLAHGGSYTPSVPVTTGTVVVSSNIASQFSIDGGPWLDCSSTPVSITIGAGILHSILFADQSGYLTPAFNNWTVPTDGSLIISAEYVVATGMATIVFHYTGIPVSSFPARAVLMKQIGVDWSVPASWTNAGVPTPEVPYPVTVEAGRVYQIGFQGISGWSWSAIPIGRPHSQLGRGCYTPILADGQEFHVYCTWVQGLSYPMWDFNQDGVMTIADRAVFEAALGSTPVSANWNRLADFNNDGIVDIEDQEVFEQHMTEGIN